MLTPIKLGGGSDTEDATEVVGPPAMDWSSSPPPPDTTTPIPLTGPTADTVGGGAIAET